MATQFARYLMSPLSPIEGISDVILPLDLRARKALLSICRCQTIPTRKSKLIRQIQRGYPEYTRCEVTTKDGSLISLAQIVESLTVYIVHPISNGFLQMVIKTLPLGSKDVERAIEEGYAKEIVASQERRYTPAIDVTSVLSPFRKIRARPLLRGWGTFNQEIHDYIFGRLMAATTLLTQRPYYPNYGRKILPDTSLKNFRELQDEYGCRFEETTRGVEAFHSRTGVYPQGPTEMKHAFGYNDLRPRIYFSRGSTHYVHSKYIQEVFNRILEAFPCVHKFERFHISRLEIQHDQIFMVYDFSTFTTNLQSLSEFLHGLGDIYDHLNITVIDTYLGPVSVNLGLYLHSYATECNDLPRYETFFGSPDGEPITFVSGAGLLGIPGNISSSTLWHAIILMCLIQSILAKIVGDDAGAVLPEREPTHKLILALNEFGDVSMPKTEEWPHVDIMTEVEKIVWQYVKRQIYRLEDKIHCGETPMQFPNPSLFIEGFADEFHNQTHIEDPVLASIKCANRFVFECQKYSLQDQDPSIIEMCRRYHNFILRAARKDDERRIELQQARFPFFQDVVEQSFEAWFSNLPSLVRIPELASGMSLPEEWVSMRHYHVAMMKPIKLICDMEYGFVKMLTKVVKNTEEEVLREYYEGRLRPLYLFVMFDDCPIFLRNLIPTLGSSPDYDDIYYTQPTSIQQEFVDLETLFD